MYKKIGSKFHCFSLILSHLFLLLPAYRNAAEIVQYGVKNNTTFLECAPSLRRGIYQVVVTERQRQEERGESNAGAAINQGLERALNHHPSVSTDQTKKGRTHEHPLMSLGWQVPPSLKSFVHWVDGLIRNPICLLSITRSD